MYSFPLLAITIFQAKQQMWKAVMFNKWQIHSMWSIICTIGMYVINTPTPQTGELPFSCM